MSREFLVWFEPVAAGLWLVACVFAMLSLIAAGVFIFNMSFSIMEGNSTHRSMFRKGIIFSIVGMVVFMLVACVLNPFTYGPKLYDEAHKTPPAEKE